MKTGLSDWTALSFVAIIRQERDVLFVSYAALTIR